MQVASFALIIAEQKKAPEYWFINGFVRRTNWFRKERLCRYSFRGFNEL